MNPSDAPPRSSTLVEWLRWLCVLPAAGLVRFAARLALGLATRGAGQETFALLARKLIVYSVSEALFVVVGAKVAPRRQCTVALVLAALGTVLSLLKHVVVQYAAGNRVGSTNFTDFGLDAMGLACGATFVWVGARRARSQESGQAPAGSRLTEQTRE
jgi:hypothetical protein